MDSRRTKQYPTGVKPHGNSIQIKFKTAKGAPYQYETIPWKPTPANLNKAGKLRQDIHDAVRLGTFRFADFFPDSPKALQIAGGTFASYAQTWLDSPENDWKPQTRYKFKGVLNRVWMPTLHDQPINTITYTKLIDALKNATQEFEEEHQHEPSQSLYNDWLTCVRGVFDTAILDRALRRTDNPAAELRNKTRTKTEPDPFDLDEANAIITDIYKHDGDMWGAWFELGFFTGMRYPSEPSALLWQAIDLNKGETIINQIRTRHAKEGIQKTTKTGVARTIILNSRALSALKRARAISGFKDEWVFMQITAPKQNDKQPTYQPVITGDPQRAMWRASLKRLGIRYRDPYNMRHSYATIGLMAGANPAFMANQLGHSVEEFFKTYAKWINRINNQFQMGLIEAGIQNTIVEKTQRVKK